MSFYLYGASGHAKVIVEILEKSGEAITGLFDDNKKIVELLGYKCINYSKNAIENNNFLIISIGDNWIRKKIADKLRNDNINFGVARDKTSIVSERSKLGFGTVVMPGSVINSVSIVGVHSIINTNSSVDHDCIIEDFVHISPGVTISGNVTVGEGTHIGSGACVLPNLNIGKWCSIGAGAVIINDIPDYSIVVGNPGKIIRTVNYEK